MRKKQSKLCKNSMEEERQEALERLCKLYVDDAPMALERMLAAHADNNPEEYELCRSWLLRLGVKATVIGAMKRNGRRAGGKVPKGSRSPGAKLSESDVVAIRKSDEPQTVLANRYGVSDSVIADVRKKKTWKSVE